MDDDWFQKKIAEKRALLAPETDAYRVLTEGERWRGVSVDALAGRFLVSLRNAALPVDLRDALLRSGADCYIKRLDREQKEPPTPLNEPKEELVFPVQENGARFLIDMKSGYSQGLFIDQRDNRARLRDVCRPGMTVLNLFAYTGAFSVCAALSGATTTTLDLAQPCLSRCKENMKLNGIDPERHYFCRGDARHWLGRFAVQNRRFSIIVMDPPTFSRDAKGKLWRAEKDYATLVASAAKCLVPGGTMLCCTNSRRLSEEDFYNFVQQGVPVGARLQTLPMPADFTPENYLKTLWIHT